MSVCSGVKIGILVDIRFDLAASGSCQHWAVSLCPHSSNLLMGIPRYEDLCCYGSLQTAIEWTYRRLQHWDGSSLEWGLISDPVNVWSCVSVFFQDFLYHIFFTPNPQDQLNSVTSYLVPTSENIFFMIGTQFVTVFWCFDCFQRNENILLSKIEFPILYLTNLRYA